MPPTSDELLVVLRVDDDATIVALAERDPLRLRRVVAAAGGSRSIDARLRDLLADGVPGGIPPADRGPRIAQAHERLRESIAAARIRLIDDESTLVAVRFPGRAAFVSLERDAVVAALRPEIAAIVAAVDEVREPGIAVLALDGVAAVPGLLDRLPRQLAEVEATEIEKLSALLDSASLDESVPAEEQPEPALAAESEPEAVAEAVAEEEQPAAAEAGPADASSASPPPAPETVPRPTPRTGPPPGTDLLIAARRPAARKVARPTVPTALTARTDVLVPRGGSASDASWHRHGVAVLARTWPVAAATIVVLALGGAAAAIGLGAPTGSDGIPTAPAPVRSADRGATSEPTAPATPVPVPSASPGASQGGAAAPNDAKPRITPRAGTGSVSGGTTTAPGSPTVPVPPPAPAPSPSDPAPTETPTPSPTPEPTDPPDLGDILSGLLTGS